MKNYYWIDVSSINQLSAEVFFGSVCFNDLNESVRLTNRLENIEEFQREVKTKDYKKIKDFLKFRKQNQIRKALPIFPTPLILGVTSETDEEVPHDIIKIEEYFNNKKNDVKALFYKNDKKLYIPKKGQDSKENIILLVDGQHRFMGVRKYFEALKEALKEVSIELSIESLNKALKEVSIEALNKALKESSTEALNKALNKALTESSTEALAEVLKEVSRKTLTEALKEALTEALTEASNFQFLVTCLVENDIYLQSIVFADVNFNQKPVNKSLMYDILSVVPNDKNTAIFAHSLVRALNNSNEFKNIVKMLGSGQGVISSAFMVETLKENLIEKGNLLRLYNEYFDADSSSKDLEYKKLPTILIDYFIFIKENLKKYFPSQNNGKYEANSFLFKTTGIYGLLMLFNDILLIINIKEYDSNIFKKQLMQIFKDIIDKQDIIFDSEKYNGAGSRSLQRAFYKDLQNYTKDKIDKIDKKYF